MAEQALYKVIAESFNLGELKLLCRDIGVEYENLEGETLLNRALALQNHAERHGYLDALVEAVAQARPHLDLSAWGGPPPETAPDAPPEAAPGSEPAAAPPGSSGVTFSNISGSSISVGGSVAGRDVVSIESAPSGDAPAPDLVALLQRLVPQVRALRSHLSPGDAEDAEDELSEALTLAQETPPNGRRIARRLNNVTAILGTVDGPTSKSVLDQIRHALTLAEALDR